MSLIGNNGSGKTNWYGFLGTVLEKFFNGDVAEGLDVAQNSPLGMSVIINPGTAKIAKGSAPSKESYLVRHDTSGGVTETITTANPSNPRRDLVVAYYKTSLVDGTNPNNPGALQFVVVAGTPASTPADPNASAIQAAITTDGGQSSDPYIILARVAVAAGATQITNANITDLRSWVKPFLAPGALVTADYADYSVTPQKFTNPYKFSAYLSAGQNTVNGSVLVNLNSESFDTNNDFNTTSHLFVAPVAGYYHFDGMLSTSANAAVQAALAKNGSIVKYGTFAGALGFNQSVVSGLVQLNAGDTIGLMAVAGGSFAIQPIAPTTYLDGYLVSRT